MKRPEHGKNLFVMRDACKKGKHEWRVSEWTTLNRWEMATKFFCMHCLVTVGKDEAQLQHTNAMKAQPSLPQEQGT